MAVSCLGRVGLVDTLRHWVVGSERRDLTNLCLLVPRDCCVRSPPAHRTSKRAGMAAGDTAIMVGGVDRHAEVHHAAALDGTGRRLGERAFHATRPATSGSLPGSVASARSPQ